MLLTLWPRRLVNTLRRGRGQGRFEEVMPSGGVLPAVVKTSRGLAAGDLDNDGGIDLVVINRDAPVTVLRNRVGTGRHWVQFELRAPEGRDPRNAIRLDTLTTPQRPRPADPSSRLCPFVAQPRRFRFATAFQTRPLRACPLTEGLMLAARCSLLSPQAPAAGLTSDRTRPVCA